MREKRICLALVVIAAILLTAAVPVMADSAGNVGIMVNNQALSGTSSAVNSNGVVMVPVKEFAASLGGTFNYDKASMSVTICQGENELVFRLDDSIVKLNGKYIQAPGAMKVINYRFMIPAQFTAEKFGAAVYMSAAKNLMMVFQPVNGNLVYQAMSGDSLWIISQLFGTSISGLKQLNGLTTDSIYVGQTLIIKAFTPSNSVFPAIITKNATLRTGPGSSTAALNIIPAWTNVNIVGKSGGWFKITSTYGNGYVYYSVISVKQDISSTSGNSTYFNNIISIDTSKDTITYIKYTVQKNDYLWAVSLKFGIPDYELAAANNISNTANLVPGQVLTIPVHTIPVKNLVAPGYGELLDWFKEAQYVFPIGKVGKFIDLETGNSFMAKRTMGATHSDTEALTYQDAQMMKQIFGGSWTWNTRPFILEVDGRRIAISVSGMPHAGVDGVPFLQNVDNRSDGWGYGPNLDSISGNGMDGHFDVYFTNCLRHKDYRIDSSHQYNVLVAGGLQ